MSDLENLWNNLNTGAPPVDDILREGRAQARSRARRVLTRPLVLAGSVIALVAAFVAGTVVADPSSRRPQAGPSPVAFQADLTPAKSCDELLASYRDRGRALVTEWGWGPPSSPSRPMPLAALRDRARDSDVVPQTASESGTNVQEAGVDEPDTVKTDGKLVVRLRGDDLVVHDVSGIETARLSSLNLPRFDNGEILLDGDTVVAIGEDTSSARDDTTGLRRGSRVVTVSLAKPSEPEVTSTVTYSSRVISARQRGSAVHLVMSTGLPTLDFTEPQGQAVTRREALAANRRVVERSTLKEWLPTYDAGGGSKPLLDCTGVAIPPDELGLDTVSVVGFNTDEPTTPRAIGLAGATTIAYQSADHLFLAAGPIAWDCRSCDAPTPLPQGGSGGGTSQVFDFELRGTSAVHVASGEVEGTIADRWSMDESDDILRVAVGPSSETGNFNSVVTFRRKGQELVEIGRIGGLGKGEDLKGVRWFDDLAILVTFRQVDPLYTIDLADPARPATLGKLKIPGYSDYLHPLSTDDLLGIGYGGSGGAQIALFDVSDLSDVQRSAVERYKGAEPIAAWEPRAFTWLPEQKTVLTVLQRGSAGYVAALTVREGKLRSRLTKVEYGEDVSGVRTLGLPDGRVVIVTGEDVRFFNWS